MRCWTFPVVSYAMNVSELLELRRMANADLIPSLSVLFFSPPNPQRQQPALRRSACAGPAGGHVRPVRHVEV